MAALERAAIPGVMRLRLLVDDQHDVVVVRSVNSTDLIVRIGRALSL